MPSLKNFLRNMWVHRQMLWAMALQNLRNRYTGTYAGTVWAIVQPVAMIGTYWFVLAVGFKVQSAPGDLPFEMVFLVGMLPWLFFSEVLSMGVSGVAANAHLVKSTTFPIEIISLVYIVAGLIPHMFMLVLMIAAAWAYGFIPTLNTLFLLYFLFSMLVLATGLTWLTSALNVFVKDVSQIMGLVLSVWFWLTPIVWSAHTLSPSSRAVVALNPMFYVTEGYRQTVLGRSELSIMPFETVCFWLFTGGAFLLGAYVFRRLKSEFADVL